MISLFSADLYLDMNSAQFGDWLIVVVICLFRVLRGFLGRESAEVREEGRRMISWREEGGRVKRRGIDILGRMLVGGGVGGGGVGGGSICDVGAVLRLVEVKSQSEVRWEKEDAASRGM